MLRVLILSALVLGTMPCLAADLVKNPGFEAPGKGAPPAEWSGRPNVYSRDTAQAHSGEASLKFVNDNPEDYSLCSQRVPLEHGRMYEISAWVKTQGIKGDDSGATLCVEWQDAHGDYLGGHYPRGLKGDTDWTQIKAVTGRIPDKAAACSITCYVRQGMTGVAWWDDVAIQQAREDPLACVLTVPNYRAEVTDAGPKEVCVKALCNLTDYEMGLDDVVLAWRIIAEGAEKPVREGMIAPVTAAETDLRIPAQDLAPGRYAIDIALRDNRTGEAIGTESVSIVRKTAALQRKAWFDAHNRLILDGEPFFPLGMYWSSIKQDELDVYADSAFNCLMPYGAPSKEQMDLAHERGLKVIYSVKDIYFGTRYCPDHIRSREDELPFIKGKVEAFRDHPALLAWYINDELPLEMVDRLALHRQWMEDLDPHHPAWVVLYQVDKVRGYLPSFDVIGTDPYPIAASPPSRAGDWTRKTVGAVCGARPVWQVPQVFNWACYKKSEKDKAACRTPTYEEMRSMAWQCIAEGANGLIFYSWFDIRRDPATPFEEHWPKVKAMAAEIKDMMPVLLSTEAPPAIEVRAEEWLHHLVKRLGETTYVVLVNNSREEHQARVALGATPQSVLEHGAGTAIEVDAVGTIRPDLAPLDVKILEVRGIGPEH